MSRFRLKYYLRYVKEYLRSFPPRLHMLSPCHFVRRLYHRTIQYTVYLKCPTQSSLGGTIDSCGPSSRQGIRLVRTVHYPNNPPYYSVPPAHQGGAKQRSRHASRP